MILHCVFCDVKSDVDYAQLNQVFRDLQAFSTGLNGVQSFDFGPNLDFEGKSKRFNIGFVIHFADQATSDTYAQHPVHQQLGAKLCELCNGGADGIMVSDLKV